MDDATLTQLLDDLTSPDPALRDEKAWSTVAEAVMTHQLTEGQRSQAAERARKHLRMNEIQARSFAPLVLDVLVETGGWEDVWFEEVSDWYLGEEDLRGYDEKLGWLHAVAHGADFLAASALSGQVLGARVVDVLVLRCVTPTRFVWRDQEEVRVARAVAQALSDPRLTATEATTWLEEVRTALTAIEPGPPPAWSSNTLHALHVGLDHEILHDDEPVEIVHRDRVKEAVARTIEVTQPWFWKVR